MDSKGHQVNLCRPACLVQKFQQLLPLKGREWRAIHWLFRINELFIENAMMAKWMKLSHCSVFNEHSYPYVHTPIQSIGLTLLSCLTRILCTIVHVFPIDSILSPIPTAPLHGSSLITELRTDRACFGLKLASQFGQNQSVKCNSTLYYTNIQQCRNTLVDPVAHCSANHA